MDNGAGRALSQWVAKCVVVNYNSLERQLKRQKQLCKDYEGNLRHLSVCNECKLLTDEPTCCGDCEICICPDCWDKSPFDTCDECKDTLCESCILMGRCESCKQFLCESCYDRHDNKECK